MERKHHTKNFGNGYAIEIKIIIVPLKIIK
jgi:hypothetical protein